jgi:hypothetical protein
MDQKLEDIDPDARKKYDKDMKQQAKESLRRDALHLSDDDFGSKHGRDRTAKEAAARNANETAGYKAAESDAKKEYEDKSKAANAAERKQIADVTRAERAYRKENNIPISPKTNPGYYHMEGGPKASSGGGGGGAGIPKVGPKKPTDMRTGGKVSSASKRADGCAIRGKTRA